MSINSQNNRVWSEVRKRDVDGHRLLVQHATFATHVMVSAGICFGCKGRLHFVPEKVKDFYIKDLLPKDIDNCDSFLPNGYIFQQDSAPAHFSWLSQEWISQRNQD